MADPLGDLVARYARTHGPFAAATCAARFGLGVFVVEQALRRLGATGRVVSGEFTPDGAGTAVVRRRGAAACCAAARWPRCAGRSSRCRPGRWPRSCPAGSRSARPARGVEAVAAAVEQLQGVAVPASALERLVLPARVADYSPAQLDELCAGGEVVWAGAGAISGGDGWVTLAYADVAPLLLPPPDDALTPHPAARGRARRARRRAGAVLPARWPTGSASTDDAALTGVVWDLVWAGHLTNDTLAPLRAVLGGGGAHRSPAVRAAHPLPPPRPAWRCPPGAARRPCAGRWSRLPERDLDPTRRAAALADVLLERHGVVTRGAVMAEQVAGGFAAVYPVLSALEERGAARRGYFVEGLGAAQFAVPGAVDRLRALADPADGSRGGAAGRQWCSPPPTRPTRTARRCPGRSASSTPATAAAPATGHRAGRKAGALVVLVDGDLVLYVERGGRTLLSFTDDTDTLAAAGKALADAVHSGALGAMSVERADGEAVHSSPLRDALTAAGFRATPRGLRLRG